MQSATGDWGYGLSGQNVCSQEATCLEARFYLLVLFHVVCFLTDMWIFILRQAQDNLLCGSKDMPVGKPPAPRTSWTAREGTGFAGVHGE